MQPASADDGPKRSARTQASASRIGELRDLFMVIDEWVRMGRDLRQRSTRALAVAASAIAEVARTAEEEVKGSRVDSPPLRMDGVLPTPRCSQVATDKVNPRSLLLRCAVHDHLDQTLWYAPNEPHSRIGVGGVSTRDNA